MFELDQRNVKGVKHTTNDPANVVINKHTFGTHQLIFPTNTIVQLSYIFLSISHASALTIRRKRKERARQSGKLRVTTVSSNHSTPRKTANRLNHVTSSTALLQDGAQKLSTNLAKSNSLESAGPTTHATQQPLTQTSTAWNSTDSMDTPLLWQRKSDRVTYIEPLKHSHDSLQLLPETTSHPHFPNKLQHKTNGKVVRPSPEQPELMSQLNTTRSPQRSDPMRSPPSVNKSLPPKLHTTMMTPVRTSSIGVAAKVIPRADGLAPTMRGEQQQQRGVVLRPITSHRATRPADVADVDVTFASPNRTSSGPFQTRVIDPIGDKGVTHRGE